MAAHSHAPGAHGAHAHGPAQRAGQERRLALVLGLAAAYMGA